MFLSDAIFLVHGSRTDVWGFSVCDKWEIKLDNLKYVLVLNIEESVK